MRNDGIHIHSVMLRFLIMPPTVGKRAISVAFVPPSVCPTVAYIANNSITQRPSVPKFGRKVPHIRRRVGRTRRPHQIFDCLLAVTLGKSFQVRKCKFKAGSLVLDYLVQSTSTISEEWRTQTQLRTSVILSNWLSKRRPPLHQW